MCATCGCDHEALGGGYEHVNVHLHEHEHAHPHEHDEHDGHVHVHELEQGDWRRISVEQDVLAKNDRLAARNRAFFAARHIAAFNFTSAPEIGRAHV